MRKTITVLLFVFAALFGVLLLYAMQMVRKQVALDQIERREREANGLKVGTPVPAFSLPGADGRPVRLPPPGREVLINYWASWCGPCLRELPVLRDFAQRKDGKGTQVVSIALDEEADTRAWLSTHPLPYPVLFELPGKHDSSAALGNRVGGIPFTVLVSADGRVLGSRTGPFADTADLDAWLAKAR